MKKRTNVWIGFYCWIYEKYATFSSFKDIFTVDDSGRHKKTSYCFIIWFVVCNKETITRMYDLTYDATNLYSSLGHWSETGECDFHVEFTSKIEKWPIISFDAFKLEILFGLRRKITQKMSMISLKVTDLSFVLARHKLFKKICE